ncbi:hypothetical protein CBS147346_7852 [Aspergillus niger]|nr:hypothetical protein CBS147346_7852 [Aspergillus niger]
MIMSTSRVILDPFCSLCTYPGCSADHLSRVLVRRLQTLRFILHCLSFGFKVLDFNFLKHVFFLISYHRIVRDIELVVESIVSEIVRGLNRI